MNPVRNGFPWWVPLATTLAAVLIAVLISRSVDAAWEASVRLWAADERPPAEYAALLHDPDLVDSATGTMMSSETGSAQVSELSVELRDTLIILTVRAVESYDAENLALSIAEAAANEARMRYEGDSGLRVLGLTQPRVRRAAPSTERNGAIAAAVGLVGGFALAAALARPARAASVGSSLGRAGRVGLRTIAVLPEDAHERTPRSDEPPPSAQQLADALDMMDRSVASVAAFIPLDASVNAYDAAAQAARALAGREHAVLWLDARPPAFQLEITTPPPLWLEGSRWAAIPRSELIRRALELYRRQPQQVVVLGPALVDPDALLLAGCCDRVVLVAASHTPADQLADARARLARANLLGVALTDAEPGDTQAFMLAQATD